MISKELPFKPKMESIYTERAILRPLTLAEAPEPPELFRTVGDAEVMKYWLGGPDKSLEQTGARIVKINSHWKKHGFGDWGIELKKSGELIGFCGLHYIEGMVEVNIGYVLEKEQWRQGYGYEVSRTVLDYGFGKLGLSEIVAIIWPENTASIRLAEKLGMKFWQKFIWKGGDRAAYIVSG